MANIRPGWISSPWFYTYIHYWLWSEDVLRARSITTGINTVPFQVNIGPDPDWYSLDPDQTLKKKRHRSRSDLIKIPSFFLIIINDKVKKEYIWDILTLFLTLNLDEFRSGFASGSFRVRIRPKYPDSAPGKYQNKMLS